MKLFLALALLASATAPSWGLDGAEILRIPATARGLSLGGAEACTGTEALFYNPSGLAGGSRPGVALGHAQLYRNTRLDVLAASAPTALGTLGAGALVLTQAALDGRDGDGNATGSFRAYDRVVSLSWAGTPARGWRLGIGAKELEMSIAGKKARAVLTDLGLQAHLHERLTLGVSVMNLGKSLQFQEEAFSPPVVIGAALGIDVGGGLGLLASARQRPNEGTTDVGVGAELGLGPAVLARAALQRPLAYAAAGGQPPLAGFAGGLGLKLRDSAIIDYSFSPGVEALGQTHRLTLRFQFGSDAHEAPPKVRSTTWDNYWRRDADGRPL